MVTQLVEKLYLLATFFGTKFFIGRIRVTNEHTVHLMAIFYPENGEINFVLFVEAKNHTRALGDWIGSYEKFALQESDQTSNRPSESVEFSKVKEFPKVRKKKVKKFKKKLGKKRLEKKEKDKWLLVKKKRFPKSKKKNTKRKRNKTVKKFVKTVSDRSNDSNMSATNEIDMDDDTPVDIIVHIKMTD
ncbi:unnamed protein product [Parnassius mnemosyne]|uniref:Uncharacterized protein n=1 Tax=Parnassius mnemosyne TaxID=213953 RepID=A0AAV1LFM6_9NEOP